MVDGLTDGYAQGVNGVRRKRAERFEQVQRVGTVLHAQNARYARQHYAKTRKQQREHDREHRRVRPRDVGGRQRRDEAPVLERADNHAGGADQHERDADAVRRRVVHLGLRRALALLDSEKAQEQAEARDDKAERHHRKPRADPCEQRALGGEKNAGIAFHGVPRLHRAQPAHGGASARLDRQRSRASR